MNLKIGFMTVPVRPMEPTTPGDFLMDGVFRPGASRIDINPSIAPARQAEVLLHEVLHAAWFAAAIPEKPTEEVAVTGLARSLAQVIRDNPELLGALVAGLEGVAIFPAATPQEIAQTPPAPRRGRS